MSCNKNMLISNVLKNRSVLLILLDSSWIIFKAQASAKARSFQPALFHKIPLVKSTGGIIISKLSSRDNSWMSSPLLKHEVCKSINVNGLDDGYFDCDLIQHTKDSSGMTMTSAHGYIHFEVNNPVLIYSYFGAFLILPTFASLING